eukprot:7871059-Pyramimonas_sp.AAC.1
MLPHPSSDLPPLGHLSDCSSLLTPPLSLSLLHHSFLSSAPWALPAPAKPRELQLRRAAGP